MSTTRESITVILPAAPPATTHHAKMMCLRRRGRRVYPAMIDKPALKAAKSLYLMLLAASGKRPPEPFSGPVELHVVLCFDAPAVEWYIKKPDRDNCLKTLTDCLVDAGWIAQDSTVVTGDVQKICGPRPFVGIPLGQVTEDAAAGIYEAWSGLRTDRRR